LLAGTQGYRSARGSHERNVLHLSRFCMHNDPAGVRAQRSMKQRRMRKLAENHKTYSAAMADIRSASHS
jgi:hypothetical protein